MAAAKPGGRAAPTAVIASPRVLPSASPTAGSAKQSPAAHAAVAWIASSRYALLAMTTHICHCEPPGLAFDKPEGRLREEAISLHLLMRPWPRLLRRLRLLAMTRLKVVIASEAKQSRFTCSCGRGADCFRLRSTSFGGQAVAQRAPRNDDLRHARDMSLSCKRPGRWAPGAIPTVDFLLYGLGAVVKKTGVKSYVEHGHRFRRRAHSRSASDASSLTRVRSNSQACSDQVEPRAPSCPHSLRHPRLNSSAEQRRAWPGRRIARQIARLARAFAQAVKTCEFGCANCQRVRASTGERCRARSR